MSEALYQLGRPVIPGKQARKPRDTIVVPAGQVVLRLGDQDSLFANRV